MSATIFDDLLASVAEMDEILAGQRAPTRVTTIDGNAVRQIRAATGLAQVKFAALLHVDVATLRNWEQGRRVPTGPAQALLRAVARDPVHVLRALA